MRPKITLTDEDIKKVEGLASSLTQQQIADYFGICVNTLKRLMEDNPQISDSYRRGKAMAVIDVAGSLIREAKNGNVQAAQFYLKTQAGWKETERREISGIDGAPIETDNKWTIEIVGAYHAITSGQE